MAGFVDLQVNGFGGVDFLDADSEGYRRAGAALLETGVTAYLPTFITSPEEQLLAAMHEVPRERDRPRILGMHLEGPFLSPSRLGTHGAEARLDPDVALLDRLLDAGPVRLMTLAPELPGADAVIDRLIARGVAVSLGHSDATAEQANAAFDRGVHSVTHLFNAMRPFRHRDPGIVGAALARDDVIVSVILDGIHLAPETAAVVWRAARDRVALVTDAITAAGRADGSYSFGTLDIAGLGRRRPRPGGRARGQRADDDRGRARAARAGRVARGGGARRDDRPRRGDRRRRPSAGSGSELPADLVVLDDRLDIARVLVAGEVRVAA